MFGFSKKQKQEKDLKLNPTPDPDRDSGDSKQAQLSSQASMFSRLKSGLSSTRSRFSEGINTLIQGEKVIDAALLDDIETQLLSADVGIEATDQIITHLKQKLGRKQLADPAEFILALKHELMQILEPCELPLEISSQNKPFVIMMVGVNGVGKTTTIGKLAKRLQAQGHKVMLAAGDTFRAAAVEQLQVWGQRNNVPVVAQDTGADSASVIYDALQSARAKQVDVLIADTAGRLHTKDNLMPSSTTRTSQTWTLRNWSRRKGMKINYDVGK